MATSSQKPNRCQGQQPWSHPGPQVATQGPGERVLEDGLIGHDGSPVGALSLELLGWLVEEQPGLAQPQNPPGTLGSSLLA